MWIAAIYQVLTILIFIRYHLYACILSILCSLVFVLKIVLYYV